MITDAHIRAYRDQGCSSSTMPPDAGVSELDSWAREIGSEHHRLRLRARSEAAQI